MVAGYRRSFGSQLTVGAVATAVVACSQAPGEDARSSAAKVEIGAAQCARAQPWAAGVSYRTGDLVAYGGQVYECIQAHTSLAGWTPDVVAALWEPTTCAASGGSSGGTSAGGSSSGGSSTGGSTAGQSSSGSTGSGGTTCDPSAWVYMGSNTSACNGHLGEACGWTSSNEGQGYTCQTESWGVGCEPGGSVCSGATGSGGGSSGGTGGGGSSSSSGSASSGSGFTQTFSTWYCGDACGSNDLGSCGTTYCGSQVTPTVLGAALSITRMNGPSGTWMGGGLCGKQIEIVVRSTGQSIVVPVIDACEACDADDHVDLTIGVWNALGLDPCAGTFQQEWRFLD